MKTDPIRLEQLMQKIAGSDLIETNATANGTPLLVVAAESIVRVLLRFKEEPSLDFEQLVDIAAVDWPDRAPRFEMVYTLLSLSRNRRLHIMVRTEAETPVPSAVGVYPSAGWCEREIWDLFGIRFSDHPDLRRILTEYDFDGHPLRKDFPLTGFVEVHYDHERHVTAHRQVDLPQAFRDFNSVSPWTGMTDVQVRGIDADADQEEE